MATTITTTTTTTVSQPTTTNNSGPGAYKIPSFNDTPLDLRVTLLRDASNPRAIHSSKAIGEPPLMLGSCVFLAARECVKAARAHAAVEAQAGGAGAEAKLAGEAAVAGDVAAVLAETSREIFAEKPLVLNTPLTSEAARMACADQFTASATEGKVSITTTGTALDSSLTGKAGASEHKLDQGSAAVQSRGAEEKKLEQKVSGAAGKTSVSAAFRTRGSW